MRIPLFFFFGRSKCAQIALKDRASAQLRGAGAEQIYMDLIQPTLNNNLFANWSTYNKGATGYIRSEIANSKLSLSFLNRSFNKSTLELHKQNRTGKKLSDITKKKISANCTGKPVILLDLIFNKEIQFDSVTSLAPS